MLFWISQQILISLIVIVLIHSIYTFLQNNLITPKIRDMVSRPAKQYQEIYNTIKEIKEPVESSSDMKNELQNYLKELSTTSTPMPSNLHTTINPLGDGAFGDNFQKV